MTKDEMKSRLKRLARKFCRRNNVYTEFDSSVGQLVEKSYLSAYFLCLHESKSKIAELEKENAELKERLLKVENAYKRKSESEWRLSDLYQKMRTDYANAEKCSREYFTRYRFMKDRCVKAKEIIKKFSEFINNEVDYNPEHPQEHTDLWNELCEQVERFLKEIE